MTNRDGAETVANNNAGPVIAPPTQRNIWFIRHGESESNAGLATPNPVLIGLTSTGHEQARRIATICSETPSLVIVSHYQRTKQTALPTLEKFSLESEVWDVHEFTYLGRLHGQTTTRQERSPHVDAYWYKLNPRYVDGDGSESFADFFLRTQRVVDRLLYMQDHFIMVFSHEQFITAARWLLTANKTFEKVDISVDLMMGFKQVLTIAPLANGAILAVSIHNNRPVCTKVVTSHLGYKLNS
jgi:broad specificity phosphatase PhoE